MAEAGQALLLGQMAARQIAAVDRLSSLADAEFRVFSQSGEDGIIEWLLSHTPGVPERFIEFGVEDYRESNTRFLLQHRNWRGLVIDGAEENVATIHASEFNWRHDLTAVCSFVSRENIERTISAAGFAGEIGLLSIDIDGNDYWVWEAIGNVQPHFVVIECNANFGDLRAVSVPYDPSFQRLSAHYSGLYFGASVKALELLGRRKGFELLGSSRNGVNLFFARADHAAGLRDRLEDCTPRPSRVRESRNEAGDCTFLGGPARTSLIAPLPVVDVVSGEVGALSSFAPLFSARWNAGIAGAAW